MNKNLKHFGYTLILIGMITLLLLGSMINRNTMNVNSLQDSNSSIIKTNATPALKWSTTWNGANYSLNYGLAIGPNDEVYLTGRATSFSPTTLDDIPLVKLYSNGALAWNVTWGGSSDDIGDDIAISADGSIYVVGYTKSFGAGEADLVLIKFHPDGAQEWNRTWGGPLIEYGQGVALLSDGSIICVGRTSSFGVGNEDLAVVKFYSNGMKAWNVTWGGSGDDTATDVVIGADGFIYVTGWTGRLGTPDTDFVIAKFTSDGIRLWNNTWGGHDSDVATGIEIGADGSLYIAGYTGSYGAGFTDVALVKCSPSGNILWMTTWGGPSYESAYGIAKDSTGALYISALDTSFGAGAEDFAIVKFDPNGVKLWNTTWGTISTEKAEGDIAFDSEGSLYVSGWTIRSGGMYVDFALVKFSMTESSSDIPGFELVYLLIGLLVVLYCVHRKYFNRTLP